MKLYPKSLGLAAAVAASIFYLGCVLLMQIASSEALVTFFNSVIVCFTTIDPHHGRAAHHSASSVHPKKQSLGRPGKWGSEALGVQLVGHRRPGASTELCSGAVARGLTVCVAYDHPAKSSRPLTPELAETLRAGLPQDGA